MHCCRIVDGIKKKHKKQPWSKVECFASGCADWQSLKRHSVGTCLRHVSMQTARYQRIGNMPKACPYVMMQFALVPIVVDINHRICQSKGDWVDFICAFGYLITEDWFFAEGERFFIC